MNAPAETAEPAKRGGGWKIALGIALSVALLYYALRDVQPAELLDEMQRADPLLLLAAVAVATSMFFLRALRWGALLAPVVGRTSLHARWAATCIGFMANNLLPARVGELARAFSLSRMQPIAVSASLGSLVVERILDGLTIVALLFVATAAPGFPDVATIGGRDVASGAAILAGIFLLAVLALLTAVLWPQQALRLVASTGGRLLPAGARAVVLRVAATFLTGLSVLRHPGHLAVAAAWSLAHWLVGALSFWLAFRAFGIVLPFSAALFVQSVASLAVALPAAPGFFGVYEAAFRVGLVEVWGIEAGKAVSCAIGFHIGGFIPVTVIGLIYAWRLGVSVRRVAAQPADA